MTDHRARFFAKVQRAENGCHLWTGAVDSCGYGRFSLGGQNRKAHRIAARLAGASIPGGMEVLHRCDNPRCVNPAHLRIGTHAENMADMAAKGRASGRSGTLNGRAKITAEQAAAIRTSNKPVAALAAEHDLHGSTVYRIRRGDLWEQSL